MYVLLILKFAMAQSYQLIHSRLDEPRSEALRMFRVVGVSRWSSVESRRGGSGPHPPTIWSEICCFFFFFFFYAVKDWILICSFVVRFERRSRGLGGPRGSSSSSQNTTARALAPAHTPRSHHNGLEIVFRKVQKFTPHQS